MVYILFLIEEISRPQDDIVFRFLKSNYPRFLTAIYFLDAKEYCHFVDIQGVPIKLIEF